MKHLPLLAVALLLPAPLCASERVFLADSEGVIHEADLGAQTLVEFAHVSPFVEAMAADARHLFVASDYEIHVVDLDSGRLERTFVWVPAGRVTAMATLGNELYAGSVNARVARIDVETGAVSDVRILPTSSQLDQVKGLAVDEEHLFVASYLGFVFRAPRQGGEFECIGRGLGFNGMTAIARGGGELWVGESVGCVGSLDPITGKVLAALRTDGVGQMALQGDRLLISSAYFGRISAVPLHGGARGRSTLRVPFRIDGMTVARDRLGVVVKR